MAIAAGEVNVRVDGLLDATQIRRQLAEGQYLLDAGQPEALMVLGSAFESAVHLSLTELGKETDDPIRISDSPFDLATQAVAYGVIDPEDRAVLHRFLALRDDVHSIDIAICQEVSRFTERTLDELDIQ